MPKLADIATIRNGLAFRGRIEHDEEGDTRVLQASDLVKYPVVDADQLVCVSLGKKASRHQLRSDDIVFSARGQRQIAYKPNYELTSGLPIVTASGLIMITANQKKVLPTYLHWVLNTRPVQHRIAQYTEGSNLTFISDKNLADIEIPLPALQAQKKIANLLGLHEQREQLRQQLATADEQLTQTIAWSLAIEQKH